MRLKIAIFSTLAYTVTNLTSRDLDVSGFCLTSSDVGTWRADLREDLDEIAIVTKHLQIYALK